MKKTKLLKPMWSLLLLLMAMLVPQGAWAMWEDSAGARHIVNADDFADFSRFVNRGILTSVTGNFKLDNDITLPSDWVAIGTDNSGKRFAGTFDGQGHTITFSGSSQGLFGCTDGATIQNLKLAGSISSGQDNTGSVVSTARGATKIYNVYSSVGITMTAAKSHIGGIAGQILQADGKTGEIKGCTYSGTMNLGSSTDSNGGIVGYCGLNANIEIENCFFSGSISSTGSNPRIGGILGYADDDGSTQNFKYIRNCFCDGTLSPSTGDYVGIFAGYPRGKVKDVITNNTYVSTASTNMAGNSTHTTAANNGCKKITISVTAGSNGTVSQTYVNPTTSAATQLQVVATPNAHYHFNKWSDNGAQTHNVGLTANVSLTATFVHNPIITVETNNSDYGTVSGGGEYTYNSQQTIKATPKTGYKFVQWNDGNTSASRTITVTEDKTYTATFAPIPYTITVATNSSTMGTVSGGGTYDYGTQQTIKATPKEHYHFVEWNDGNTNASRTITVNGNATYTATFAPNQHTITLKTNDSNMGTVSGGGTYNYGTQQTITATPNTGYHFEQWNDGNTDASRTITVTENKTYTATFAPNQYTITVKADNGNYGTVIGGGTYDYGTQLTITATAKTGYHFEYWYGGNTDASRTITVTENKTYTAIFAPNQYTITVKANNDNYGRVTGGGTYNYQSIIQIRATPKEHYYFVEWNDGYRNIWRNITVTEDKTYTATFAIDQHTITVKTNDSNMGTVSGSGTYNYGTQQTITATPEAHYHFVQWSDGNTDASRQITVNGNATYTATFAIDQHTIALNVNNSNMGTVTGSGTFDYNSQQVITATPNTGCDFIGWSDGVKDATRQITVTDDAQQNTYTANFIQARAILTDGTLAFYYDGIYHDGTAYPLNTGADRPGWHEKNSNITTVVFDASFASMRPTSCAFWFDDCENLSSITGIEYLNTERVTTMEYMFRRCVNLTSLDVSGFNTARVTGMESMFNSCKKLTSLNLSSFNTANVTNMAFMFENCNSLTSLDVSSFNTANVTNMAFMFANCNSLTSLNVRGFNTANVTNMNAMFFGCQNLTSLDVSNFNTENVMYMNEMFSLCENLSTLDLSSFNTANVTMMEGMFRNCPKLKNLIIDRFNMQNVTHYDEMFFSSLNLTTLTLKSLPYLADGTFNTFFNNKTVNLELSANSFIYDINEVNHLPKITYCNHYGSPVDHYAHVDPTCTQDGYEGYECIYCKNAISKTILYPNLGGHKPGDDGVCTVCHAEQKALAVFNDCTLTFCKDFEENNRGFVFQLNDDNQMPDWLYLAEEIKSVVFEASFQDARPTSCYDWFSNCTNIETITGLEYLNTSEVTNMGVMFFGCSSLQSLNLSKFNTANVTNMTSMFHGCSSLQSLDLSSFNTAKVTGMAAMFAECNNLTRLDLSSFNTANVTWMDNMFTDCSSLQSLDLSSFNTANVEDMSGMFDGCSSLESLDLSSFNTANVEDMSGMFDGCSSLESLDLGNFNTENVMYMDYMFADCSSLQSLDLSSFKTESVWGMNGMFDGCSSLQSLKLSNDFVLGDDCDTRTMFLDCGNAENKCQIYYALGDDLRNKLREGTEFDSNRMEFVESAIVKDGVPFNVTIARGGCDIPAENVVFTRTFTPNKPATITLPFEVHANDVTNAKFYGFTSLDYNNATGKWEANMDRVKDSYIQAYTPYMILTEAESIDFGDEYVDFVSTPSELHNTTQGDWTFVALNETKTWEEGDPELGRALLVTEESNTNADDNGSLNIELVKIEAGTTLKAGRCYFLMNTMPTIEGDVNGDGIITVADLTQLIEILNGRATDTTGNADVDGKNGVTIDDVEALRNIILGTQSSNAPDTGGESPE